MTPPISIQLYTLREGISRDATATLARLADAGFTRVEPYDLLELRDVYAAALPATGLAAPSAHDQFVGLGDPAPHLRAAADLGVEVLVEAAVDAARWTTRESVEGIARELADAAARARDLGLRVGYHNHWWELENRIDGAHALEVFADALPDDVVLEVDVYWAAVGGADAPALLRRLGERVRLLHVKDGPVTRDARAQLPAGRGSVDWDAVFAAAPTATRVIEFDDYAGDVFDGVLASLDYLRGRGDGEGRA
jgi:sugar phosphate isomerase/epimerase